MGRSVDGRPTRLNATGTHTSLPFGQKERGSVRIFVILATVLIAGLVLVSVHVRTAGPNKTGQRQGR